MKNDSLPSLPERVYTDNIRHNPYTWMGIWTPHGWRANPMRWGRAERFTRRLSGDGATTFFEGALRDPQTSRVAWMDDLHLKDDPFTDRGIYPCDPRVEYPPGQPRWAVSHTLLCYPFCDHNLYTHEYTWDMRHGNLETHFRKHVRLEEARTDADDGMTVRVRNRPISRTIEGNVSYPLPNSAVRGVWGARDRSGPNFYTRRTVEMLAMHNGVYLITPVVPVVQCHGLWVVSPDDPVDEVFDRDTGELRDRERLIEEFLIPLDQPKIAMLDVDFTQHPSRLYECDINWLAGNFGEIGEDHLAELLKRKGSRYERGRVGFAAGTHGQGIPGDGAYDTVWDYDGDGVIDDNDEKVLRDNLGRKVRYNLYRHAYYGGDWLTTYINVGTAEHEPGVPVIADYVHGAGYDAESGVVRLFDTPGPDQPVWVEYFHDAPAEPGDGNILLHLYRE